MKKIQVILASSCFLFSFAAWAQDGAYAGIDASIINNAKLSVKGQSAKSDTSIGANLYAGYKFELNNYSDIGFDIEHRKMGGFSFPKNVKADAYGYYINARPTLYEKNGGYASLILGIGTIEGYLDGSDRSFSYQAGVEVGYPVTKNIDIGIGYRYAFAKFDISSVKVDADIAGFTLGARYHF
ncbi:TPA: outer membrane beta-barrel protein [Vibrio harveyi]